MELEYGLALEARHLICVLHGEVACGGCQADLERMWQAVYFSAFIAACSSHQIWPPTFLCNIDDVRILKSC